ncbi:MAG: hypothetical protein ABIH76_00600 [Candidatus Bathyarchaeota archaeon]
MALLFGSVKEEKLKKPELELFLLDKGNTVKKIIAQPKYTKMEEAEDTALSRLGFKASKISELLRRYPHLTGPLSGKPSEDLVPIGIEVQNVGTAPAKGINVFLHFPEECELFDEILATGNFATLTHRSNTGGISVNESKNEVMAWVNVLGNDLQTREFGKVYAKFPAKDGEYKISYNSRLVIGLGKITVVISDNLETKLREIAFKKTKGKRGGLSLIIEEALAEFVRSRK